MRKLLSLSVVGCYPGDLSAHLRNPQKSKRHFREENYAAAVPCASHWDCRLAERLYRPPRDLYFLEPTGGEEPDESTIRRPEREDRSFRAGKNFGLHGIE